MVELKTPTTDPRPRIRGMWKISKVTNSTGEMGQQLRALAELPEDSGLVPNTHTQPSVTLVADG